MNSVANQLVATMMNSNFNAMSSLARKGGTVEFSNVFQKAQQQNTKPTIQSEPKTVDTKVKTPAGQHHEKADTKVEAEVVDQVKEVLEEAKGLDETDAMEKVPATEETTTEKEVDFDAEVLKDTLEEALSIISELLGIPAEALENMLKSGQMTLTELSEPTKLMEVIQTVFGHEDLAATLMDPEATAAYKAVHEKLEILIEELGMDMETLKEQLQSLRGTTTGESKLIAEEGTPGHIAEPITPKGDEGQKLEDPILKVNDLREGQRTTEYSDSQPKGGEKQNAQTFGELVSQQLANLKGVSEVVQAVKADFQQQVSTQNIIDQIVTKAMVNLNGDKTSMQLQLNPEHLGKVAVSLTAEQGVVKGQFVAENHVVKEILETGMIQLKQQLEAQGIKVDRIEVTIGNTNQYFEQKEQQQNQENRFTRRRSNKAGRIERLMSLEEDKLTEAIHTNQSTGVQTGLLDYTVEYSA